MVVDMSGGPNLVYVIRFSQFSLDWSRSKDTKKNLRFPVDLDL